MPDSRSHTVTWDLPARAPETAGMSGLEAMRWSIAEGKRRSPISALMDIRMISADPGVVVLEGRPGEQHYNPLGIVHGGFAATLLDSALWSAVHTTIEPGWGHTTLELKVNYTRSMTTETGPVTCEGRVVHRGGRTAISEARVTGADGKLYAYGSSTLLIMKL